MPNTYIPVELVREVEQLAQGCCEYCKCLQDFSPAKFPTDHIVPLVLGGRSEVGNLAKACVACNGSKHAATSATDPLTGQAAPLFHPRKDDWHEHFQWSGDLLRMEGLTPTGRATIERLKTNRAETVNLRRVLIGQGHPPT